MTSPDLRLKDVLLAPVSPKRRTRLALALQPPECRIVYPNLVSVATAPVVFLRNSKAGCSTLAQLMYFSAAGRIYDGDVHVARDGVLRQGVPHWRENACRLGAPDHFAFSFVRHPERRITSAFANFFIDYRNPTHRGHLPGLTAHGFSPENDLHANFDAFLDFVSESLERDPMGTDRHWQLQGRNLGLSCLTLDFIGRLENMKADIEIVADRLGLASDARRGFADRRFNRSSSSEFAPTTAQKKRIRDIYRTDFEAFSYE